MNAHEVIDRIMAKPPRTKVIAGLLILAVLLMIIFGFMYAGHRLFSSWADSKYLQESRERDQKIAVLEADADRHIKNESQLAAENSLLKKQNEALAEVYKAADTKAEKKAADNFAAREAERAKTFDQIDADTDHNATVCGICDQARKAGFPLSAEFCSRCSPSK